MKRRRFLGHATVAPLAWAFARAKTAPAGVAEAGARWGNISYVDFAIGERQRWQGRSVRVLEANAQGATIEVDGSRAQLPLARRSLPVELEGLRVFVADTKSATKLTADAKYPQHRGLVQRDVLLALAVAEQPLLDPNRYSFPIDRSQGFRWSMEENSHQFAFISPERSHEGIDVDLHYARGYRQHALVAIEDATVRWVERERTQPNEACVLLESQADPKVFYVYQHLNRNELVVEPNMKIARGSPLGYIWGDGIWGHLHFAVLAAGPVPDFNARYRNVINAFPGLYELWEGHLNLRPRRYTQGNWVFDRHKAANGNRKYLSAYNPVVGYGWHLDDFCGAMTVEGGPERAPFDLDTSARLAKVLFEGTAAEARNPRNHYVFQVDVEPGRYEVQVRVGVGSQPTWQKVSINGSHVGVYQRSAGFVWTPLTLANAPRGRLLLQVALREQTAAGVSALSFRRLS